MTMLMEELQRLAPNVDRLTIAHELGVGKRLTTARLEHLLELEKAMQHEMTAPNAGIQVVTITADGEIRRPAHIAAQVPVAFVCERDDEDAIDADSGFMIDRVEILTPYGSTQPVAAIYVPVCFGSFEVRVYRRRATPTTTTTSSAVAAATEVSAAAASSLPVPSSSTTTSLPMSLATTIGGGESASPTPLTFLALAMGAHIGGGIICAGGGITGLALVSSTSSSSASASTSKKELQTPAAELSTQEKRALRKRRKLEQRAARALKQSKVTAAAAAAATTTTTVEEPHATFILLAESPAHALAASLDALYETIYW
jgi:hypothetical protein